MAGGAVIVARNVHKSFGAVKAVNGVSFSVPEGSSFGLLGPNGAGKTTLMRMVYGVSRRDREPPSEIRVFGHDPERDELAIKFVAGVVPQENNLDEELNVTQNLQVFARFYHLTGRRAAERIDALLAFTELADKRAVRIRHLSGGMKRRLVIARALLNNPRLLILDEPTTGLDPQVRHLIWEKLRALKRQGLTILLTTHYMEEAFQICDTVFIMNRGERVVEGNPQALVRREIEPYVLEIYTREAFERVRDHLPAPGTRIEESGGVVRVYSSDDAGLLRAGERLGPGDYHLRPSNLEDLFLKATGSTLNALQ
ncbi:MAG: ABC transporter ATP-binding protein [Armatimonadetes bacterium]|nr:ABC transporter ATP-binding protein [Armatimonadota bacterium]